MAHKLLAVDPGFLSFSVRAAAIVGNTRPLTGEAVTLRMDFADSSKIEFKVQP